MVKPPAEPFTLDISLLSFIGDPATGGEGADALAVTYLHTAAFEWATSPENALRLLLFASIDMAELAENAPDALTAMIGMIREWRDGGGRAATKEAIAQGFIDLRAMPVPPLTVDEVIAAASDEPTQPNRRKP